MYRLSLHRGWPDLSLADAHPANEGHRRLGHRRGYDRWASEHSRSNREPVHAADEYDRPNPLA